MVSQSKSAPMRAKKMYAQTKMTTSRCWTGGLEMPAIASKSGILNAMRITNPRVSGVWRKANEPGEIVAA